MATEKVFVVSLHRNGTRSVHKLLQGFGLTSIHHPGQVSNDYIEKAAANPWDIEAVYKVVKPLFAKADAFSDTPFNVLYPQLFRDYPDARFLALYRSPDLWIKSVRRHTAGRSFGPFERIQYFQLTGRRVNAIDEISNEEMTRIYFRYYADLMAFFNEKAPGRLLVADLTDPGIPEQIAEFLEIGKSETGKLPHITD